MRDQRLANGELGPCKAGSIVYHPVSSPDPDVLERYGSSGSVMAGLTAREKGRVTVHTTQDIISIVFLDVYF